MTDQREIEQRLWKELKGSPFVMLGLDGARDGATQPMTAFFDDESGPLWFYAAVGNSLVDAVETGGSRAILTYAAKGHDLFASIHGQLHVDTDPAVIDRFWNANVAAWYEQGRDDPKIRLLRLDTDSAKIWLASSPLAIPLISKLLGRDPKAASKDQVAEVTL